MVEKKKTVFRKKAIEHTFTSEVLEDMVKVIPARLWIILALLLLIFSIVLVWLFVGTVSPRVSGEGILTAESEQLTRIVVPHKSGVIRDFYVNPGDSIQHGDLIAELIRPNANLHPPLKIKSHTCA